MPAPAPGRTAETITSRENRWLKRFRGALRGEGARDEQDGAVGVEGARLVEEVLRTGLAVPALLVSGAGERHLERLRPWLGRAERLLRVSDKLFASVSGTESPQGVAALVRPRMWTFDDLLRRRAGATGPLVVVLVGVQDPGNTGTIVRTADAFGATGVVACRGTADPLGPKALRASAGSALRLPLLAGAAAPVAMAQLRMAGLRLCAASLSGELTPRDADLREPCALLIGNEGAGLPAEVERSADARLRIPIAGEVDSLNAAVAAAVLLYEAARQRAGAG
jgi:TrmH family RNA methyltransferase